MKLNIPLPLLTDSYKTTHFRLYPDAKKMVAYGEFRASYDKDPTETRIVFYGIRYWIEEYVSRQWTERDVELAEVFFKTHNAGFTEFPFPKDLFLKFIRENDGYFPVTIEALPEGSVVYPHVPVYQMTCKGEYSRLITYLETILTMLWYPTTVATLSRRCKQIIEDYYSESVDEDAYSTLESRLHDFGFRGCTCVEQSVVGGCAHLLNFNGTDTLSAAYYAQFHLNEGKPVATSIPATEHSVMTSHQNEREAMKVMLREFGSGVCACVMDSYDYTAALEKLLPSVAKYKLEKGGFLVLRPDSGNPIDVILEALRAADHVFGHTVNKKGFKVLNGVGVIQGDAVTYQSLQKILPAIVDAGYSVQNVGFGMGAGLLQKLNRDTMSFATKLCFVEYPDGSTRDVMKAPRGDGGKTSLPGILSVRLERNIPMVYPASPSPTSHTSSGSSANGISNSQNMLVKVYDHGPIPDLKWDTFDAIRERVDKEWHSRPKTAHVISGALKEKAEKITEELRHALDSGVAQGI